MRTFCVGLKRTYPLEGQWPSNAIGQLWATGRMVSVAVLLLKVKPLPSSSASFENGQGGRNAETKPLLSRLQA